MSENANPSVDPADTKSMSGLLRFVFKKMLQNTDGMLPAVVVAVTPDRNFATVKPLIMVQGTDGSLTARPQYAQIPVGAMGAGNYVMSFPLAPGDLGWIQASDRDISLFIQGNGEAGPNTNRLHSFEDAVFWPDKARQWALADVDAGKAVWQSLDGSIKITLGADKVTIVHPTEIELDAPRVFLNASDVLVLHGTTKTTLDAGGTGIVYQPAHIDTYTTGVPSTAHSPDPPGPLP